MKNDYIACDNLKVVFPPSLKPLINELKKRNLQIDLLRIFDGGHALRVFDERKDFLIAIYKFDAVNLCRIGMLSSLAVFQSANNVSIEKDEMHDTILLVHHTGKDRHSLLFIDYQKCYALAYESDTSSLPFVKETIEMCRKNII